MTSGVGTVSIMIGKDFIISFFSGPVWGGRKAEQVKSCTTFYDKIAFLLVALCM